MERKLSTILITLLLLIIQLGFVTEAYCYTKSINTPHREQQTSYWCGAASAQMILECDTIANTSGRRRTTYPMGTITQIQQTLYNDIQAHNNTTTPTNWFTDPDGLEWTLDYYDTHQVYVQYTKADAAWSCKKLAWTIEHYEVPPAILINGGAHWIVVYGIDTSVSPTQSGTYTITGFDCLDPGYPTGSLGADTYKAYNDFICDFDEVDTVAADPWDGVRVSVCDPDPVTQDLIVPPPLREGPLIDPNGALVAAEVAIFEHNLWAESGFEEALGSAEPFPPVLVSWPACGAGPCYCIPYVKMVKDEQLLTAVIIVHGASGEFMEASYASDESAPALDRFYQELTYPFIARESSARPGRATPAPSIIPQPVPMPPAIKINFQPSEAVTPYGCLADTGEPFGDRGNGYSYGWNAPNYEVRDRGAHVDQRYDTVSHMQNPSNPHAVWEIGLDNGTYNVLLLCGDPSFRDQINNITLETYLVNFEDPDPWDGGDNVGSDFDVYEGVVEVADGRLTIEPGKGAVNAKICYVKITPTTGSPYFSVSTLNEWDSLLGLPEGQYPRIDPVDANEFWIMVIDNPGWPPEYQDATFATPELDVRDHEDGSGRVEPALYMRWGPEGERVRPGEYNAAAWDYIYDKGADLRDAELEFSIHAPRESMRVSVNLVDADGDWLEFIWHVGLPGEIPACQWTTVKIVPSIGYSNYRLWYPAFEGGLSDGRVDLTRITHIRFDENGTWTENLPFPLDDGWMWNAWNHIRVVPKEEDLVGLSLDFNEEITNNTGQDAYDFHLEGRIESETFPIQVMDIFIDWPRGSISGFDWTYDGGRITPAGGGFYDYSGKWSGSVPVPPGQEIHIGKAFIVNCSNVCIDLRGWWTDRNGRKINPDAGTEVRPGVWVSDVPLLGFDIQDNIPARLTDPNLPQTVTLQNATDMEIEIVSPHLAVTDKHIPLEELVPDSNLLNNLEWRDVPSLPPSSMIPPGESWTFDLSEMDMVIPPDWTTVIRTQILDPVSGEYYFYAGECQAHSAREPFIPINDGLVAYYPLDGDATDASGNGNDGTIIGDPGFVEGIDNQGLDLDGEGDYVDCGSNPLFGMQETNEMTAAAWVKIRSIANQWAAIVAKGEYAWRLGNVSWDPRFHFGISIWNAPDTATLDGVGAVGFDEWHHVAGVFDGADIMIYLDGILDSSAATTEPIGTNDLNVFIGENPEATGRYWDGLIDEVYIFNRALSMDEILLIAQ